VVTDLATASAVLDFLKAKRLGRTTCIILDKIGDHRQYMNRPFENLPRAVRLFDLVKFKSEEAKLAFYFALSDTLFCEDSDLGLEYSMKNEHQRRRVICRNKNRTGYIVYEMNGLMVGSMPKRGGFIPKAATKGKSKSEQEVQAKELEGRKKEIL
jgi:structural maintenance of chromosome 4